MFTLENTEGFDQKTLDKMNAEVREKMKKFDQKSKDYKKKYSEIEDEVFDKYCLDSFSPSMKF
jgi:predicted nuclease with TOPRIM domain